MAKQRGSQPNNDAPEDALSARLLAFTKWAADNTQVLIVAGVILAVTVGAGLYYYDYQQSLQTQASQELERIHQTMVTADPGAAQTELESYLNRFEGTDYAVEARLLLAELHLRQERAGEAVSTLEPATRSLSDPLSIQAAFLLGAAYEQAARPDDAEALYLRIADNAELTFQIRQALADAARLRARAGSYAGAADLYRRVLATFENQDDPTALQSSNRTIFQLRLAEMETAAARQGT